MFLLVVTGAAFVFVTRVRISPQLQPSVLIAEHRMSLACEFKPMKQQCTRLLLESYTILHFKSV